MSPSTSPVADTATADELGYPLLLRLVAHFASTDVGRERIERWTPTADEDRWRHRRHAYEEAERLLEDGRLVPALEEPLRPLAHAVGPEGELDGGTILRIGRLLATGRAAAERIVGAEPACPVLSGLVDELPDLRGLERRIESTLDARGGIRDDASPRLGSLRRRVRRLRDRLYRQLEEEVAAHRDDLADDAVSLIEGRLVLLAKSEARDRVGGVVHGRSGSGRSVYLEPLSTVEGNNRFRSAVEDEDEERRRLLLALAGEIRSAASGITAWIDLLGRLDALQAAVDWGRACDAHPAETVRESRVELRQARHPLLDPQLAAVRASALGNPGQRRPVVPLDLALGDARRLLVVTGPNAGGKTVALETVGLLALAHQAGLPVPAAAGSRLPLFDRIVAQIGDEQDLLAEQSTFSGRLLRQAEAWNEAGERSLVLLDELGSGTDPEEGAALAVALLEELLRRGTLVMATTHLVRLAEAARHWDGAGTAAMAFDAATGEPTFRLRPGPPGGSEALALGRRLGLPSAWLERAEGSLDPESRDLRRLIAAVERELEELRRERSEAERMAEQLAQERDRLESERRGLEEEGHAERERLRRRLDSFRDEVQRRLRQELDELRAAWSEGRRRGLAREAEERLFARVPEELEAAPQTGSLVTGATVLHRRLGWQGTLVSLDGDRATVSAFGKRLELPAAELAPAEGEPPSDRPGARSSRVQTPSAPEVPAELQLRGLRVEPALEELERYLDQAVLAGRGEVRIVHGHGTGALKDAVRELLRGHRAVEAFRPGGRGEGGDGATVVTLRD